MRAFTVLDCDQLSDEWRAARLGCVTGSRAVNVFATVQKGEAAKRRDLRVELVLERITGQSQDSGYVSPEMKWGTEKEHEARALYQALTGQLVRQVGYVQHTTQRIGYSPDGVIGDFAGLIECKAPKSATHLSYVRSGKVPYEYLCQIAHGLWLTGAAFCDFVSYDPRFPQELRLFMTRVERTSLKLDAHELAMGAFLNEVDQEEAAVRALMKTAVAA